MDYHSSENVAFNISEAFLMYLQVCAPTGAGKTNIAMISILHEVCNQLAVP
jgi:CRISPR/Cas system-associated endonuclease/helicase Cas3